MLAAVCVYFCASADLFAAINFVNNNPPVTIVPYGGTYTYSVTWIETNSTVVDFTFNGPGFHTTYNFFPTNYTFNYTINGVAAANVGNYNLYPVDFYYSSTPVALYISPAILTQPQNTICLNGSSTTMGLAAGPSTATFQWFDAATGSSVSSATHSPAFTPTAANNGERIYCKINNNYGSVNSSSAIVTVGSTPVITTQPSSVGTNYGSLVTFTVTASGTQPLSYQWYKSGIAIQGANLNYITFPSVTNTDSGTYQVAITNIYGGTNSASVKLSVANPILVISQPTSLIVTQGQTTTFNITVTGDSPSYQWRKNNSVIGGATNSFYYITNTQYGLNGGTYNVVITNQVSSVTSSGALLTVVGLPSITTQPTSKTIGVGSNVTFTVTATAGASPLFYQWFNTNNVVSNQTNASLILQNLQLTDSGDYYVVITNSFGSVTSSLASLTVQQYAPTIAALQTQGAIQFSFYGPSNYPYILQAATNLTPPINWQNIITNNTDANGVWNFTDTNTVFYPVRFYRAMVP